MLVAPWRERLGVYCEGGNHRAQGGVTMSAQVKVIHSDPEIMGGTPVFVGTRVPVRALLDYLEGGDSLDTFLDHFPSVRREQAVAALELANELLSTYAHSA